jgi:hypothetical protein
MLFDSKPEGKPFPVALDRGLNVCSGIEFNPKKGRCSTFELPLKDKIDSRANRVFISPHPPGEGPFRG